MLYWMYTMPSLTWWVPSRIIRSKNEELNSWGMTDFLPLVSPFTNLQVDHVGKIAFKGRAWISRSTHNRKKTESSPPTLMINRDCFPFIPLKVFMSKLNLGLILEYESTLTLSSWFPDESNFSFPTNTCLSNIDFLSGEQPNLSLITLLLVLSTSKWRPHWKVTIAVGVCKREKTMDRLIIIMLKENSVQQEVVAYNPRRLLTLLFVINF